MATGSTARSSRDRATRSDGVAGMQVLNPATGEVLREVAEADRAAVAAAYRRARAAQPAWAAKPLAERCAAIRRFRALAIERAEPLARTLALEVGKPITQARSELAGLLPRIDFFLAEVEAALADEVVLATLTGLAIAELLHEAGIPADVFQALVGGGEVGAMLLAEPVDAVCFTGSH